MKKIISVLCSALLLAEALLPIGAVGQSGNTTLGFAEDSHVSVELYYDRELSEPIAEGDMPELWQRLYYSAVCDEGYFLSSLRISGVSVNANSFLYTGNFDAVAECVLGGDFDANGKVNLSDASWLLKYLAKWSDSDKWTIAEDITAGDMTRDGKVSLADAAGVLKVVAKWDNPHGGVQTEFDAMSTECPDLLDFPPKEFGMGDAIDGAGHSMTEDSFAMSAGDVTHEGEIGINARGIESILSGDKMPEEGMAYRLRDELILEPDEYDGQGMTLVGDVLIKGDRWTLRGVRIEGTLTVEGDDVTLRDVYAEGDSCLILNGDGVTVEDSKFVGTDTALQVHGDGTVIRNCEIQSECTGLLINGDGAIVRQCSISTKDDAGYGIYADNTANALICLSVIGGAERSVVMEGADNCAVIMNSAVSVYAGLSSNIYVIDNALGGRLSAVRSRYLIFDGNACHELVLGVTRYRNGDNITDTDVRAEVGANEALLPHTNKDLFVGMERQTTVCDGLSFTDYIKSCLETDGVVMIPPGAYSVDEDLVLEGIEGKKIYAYGVLEEFTDYPFGNKFTDCDGLDVNGITIGYSKQSSGQVYVLLSPEGTNEIKTVTAAGYINDFGTTNLDVFFMNTQEADVYRAGAPNSHTSIAYRTASKLSDGTISMMLDSDKYGIEAGDVICCRLAHGSYTTIHLDTCTDVHFRDMVTYGTADGICLAAIGKSSGLSAERWHNTARSAPVIDEETYERYAALEKRYGVDLEISIDGEGRYRGSVPRIGSIDATHINGTESGFDVKSSIFESMCDDGSNQRGYSSRLHDVVIREDGVTELYYKNNMPEWYALHSELPAGLGCEPFEIGENILVYTPEGDTFCDTEVLSAAEYVETVNYTIDGVERECHSPIYKVTVDSDAVNADALFDENGELRFDLSENHYRMDNKVIVDNLSRVSAGFTFDNVLVQNIRSRGLCIKTTDATVKNCTFRNLGNGLLLHFESEWGESTVARDVLVKDCLFENTGYLYGDYEELRYAPISIMGPETETLGERVPCRNIVIEGCRFNETAHKYHIVIRNAAGITVRDNDFGYIWDYEYEELCAPYASVSVGNARDVKISGNTCPDGIEMSDWVKVTDSVGVTVE